MSHQNAAMTANVTSFSPEIKDLEPDLTPSDSQPPGVDDEVDYNSLEEALMS